MRTFRLAMAQINPTVGDLPGNTARIVRYIQEARSLGADLVAFPEMCIPGYPPEDLLLKPQFIADNLHCLEEVVESSRGIAVVVGFADKQDDIFNAAAVAFDGGLVGVYHKIYLPNYGVFDEDRYFKAGRECPVFVVAGVTVGVSICEDIWYPVGPTVVQREMGARLVVNINASPYHRGKRDLREKMLATRASDNGLYVAYVNMVGGQDELVFDGGSMVLDAGGNLMAQGKQFEEDLLVVDLDMDSTLRSRLHDPRLRKERNSLFKEIGTPSRVVVSQDSASREKPPLPRRQVQPCGPPGEVHAALVLGTRDYIRKTGFQKVLIGLSGGIDSSLVAVLAVDALGPENVVGVSMPSRYTSRESMEDAEVLAKNLGIRLMVIPLEQVFQAYIHALSEPFSGTQPNVAEENLQARVRGNLLMALSNKFGWLVLTTGNKSEMSTGYATLYGDMAGGFAVIKDVPKTLVYEVAQYRNTVAGFQLIPRRVLEKAPTAELKPNQLDTDSLPPYPVLDPILKAYVEEDRGYQEILATGCDPETVKKAIRLVDTSEYKRRQAPPGIKITPRAFGRDRRFPLVNRYRSY